jgi:chromosomal replication initiation ATPase DnaA
MTHETQGIKPDILPVVFKVISDAEVLLMNLTGFKIDLVMQLKNRVFLTGIDAKKNILQKMVCQQFNVSWAQIISNKRDRNITGARHTYMYLSKTMLGLTLTAVGRELNKDHTTVIHAVKTITNLIHVQDDIAGKVETIKHL